MTTSLQGRTRARWVEAVDATPGELLALVAAAVGANAVTYAAILLLNGETGGAILALLVGGALLTAFAGSYLTVVYTARDIVSG